MFRKTPDLTTTGWPCWFSCISFKLFPGAFVVHSKLHPFCTTKPAFCQSPVVWIVYLLVCAWQWCLVMLSNFNSFLIHHLDKILSFIWNFLESITNFIFYSFWFHKSCMSSFSSISYIHTSWHLSSIAKWCLAVLQLLASMKAIQLQEIAIFHTNWSYYTPSKCCFDSIWPIPLTRNHF